METLTSIITTGLPGPNTGCFSRLWPLLGTIKSAPKKLKSKFFFQEKFYPLKAHVHYFIVLIYLATWRTAKYGIFTHFMLINLCTDVAKAWTHNICTLYRSPVAFYKCLITVEIALCCTTATHQKFLYFPMLTYSGGTYSSGELCYDCSISSNLT